MQDSGKALQEKFALTRELNRLRPEMEHLQSQLTNHQAVIAEKHDLRRQVDSLEVELENERRARQRTKPKNDDGEVEELRSQLQEAEKKLASTRKEKEKLKKDHEKAMAGVTRQSEQLEEDKAATTAQLQKLEADLKESHGQLKALQEELEESHAEFQAAQAASSTSAPQTISVPTKMEAPAKPIASKAKKTTAAAAETKRKRHIEELASEDASMGTPGNESMMGRPPKKRGIGRGAALEKSTFSVTPFLNRSKGLEDVTVEDTPVVPKAPADVENESAADEPVPRAKQSKKAPASKASKPRGRQPKSARLGETTASKKNVTASQPSRKATKPDDEDESAPEDDVEEQENVPSPKKAAQTANSKPIAKSNSPADKPEAKSETRAPEAEKKRKRKLLGANTTLFDDDDAELTKPMAGAAVRRLKAPLGGAGGFGSFSPLKKHKRGMNGSVLV